METRRADALRDLGQVPEVSLEYYKRSILPHVAYRDHVEEIIHVLEDDGVLKVFEGESRTRWADFPNDPKHSGIAENETFKYMATIAAAIVKAAQQKGTMIHSPPMDTIDFSDPDVPSTFQTRGLVRLWTRLLTWTPLACDRPALEEYKRGDHNDDQNDNVAKLVGNVSQAMYDDPTRRFMFGTTIENATARFWFFSRAIVLVSESFNFVKDCNHLFQHVLSLSFATEEEPGYDLSVTRIAYPLDENPSAHIIQYDYRVGENTYRTIECLTSFRASGLLSNVWIPSDAKTELEIQQEIFRSIEENCLDIDREYRKHFMDVLQCGVVQTSQNHDDDMPVIKRSAGVPTGGCYVKLKATSELERLYKSRKHVRVVFEDVGVPLSKVRQHDVLFTALANALKGLQYMFMGHYVHRDISAGNILLCDGMAKISDLEYAKKFPSGPKDDPKTGTPVYMAVEAQDRRYFLTVEEPKPVRGEPPQPPVRSIFCTITYTTWNHFSGSLAECGLQGQLFNAIFPRCMDGGTARRRLFFSADFQDAEDILSVEYKPALEQFIYLRSALAYKYNQNFDSVYATDDPDMVAFQALVDAAYNGDTQLLPEDIGIIVPWRALVFREENGDRAGNRIYADDGSGRSGCGHDEEPPHKKRRAGGNAKERNLSLELSRRVV
ncbi:uncharacterized protein EV420DRAFT_1665595 [Desarmillaria tabescens]|uniref:Fungal-type protein kinase domain-containing protein n=1 Tax=Armillaria tabescens TaxID=1929756 RepID=A0AA39TS46_ARMTA|nr:uncharacterized protein EV420DRAFT_1665595 [Desarmillaria tabescens]KAK0461954.1 hypothetical protein EV420DRAFT_1665595 [Desarmillaria tabescens]